MNWWQIALLWLAAIFFLLGLWNRIKGNE